MHLTTHQIAAVLDALEYYRMSEYGGQGPAPTATEIYHQVQIDRAVERLETEQRRREALTSQDESGRLQA